MLFGSTLSLWLIWAADLVWPGTIGHGIVPRTAYGLSGIVMAPFIHANLQHLLANTIPFLILGAVIVLRGVRAFLFVAARQRIGVRPRNVAVRLRRIPNTSARAAWCSDSSAIS